MGKSAVIVGATGATGVEIAKRAIADPRIDKVTLISRKKLSLHSAKLVQIVADFDHLSVLLDKLQTDLLFLAIGTTLKQAGSKEKQYLVDYMYPYQIAQAAVSHAETKLLLISSLGADSRSKNFYLQTKGSLEESLAALKPQELLIFRPSVLDAKRDRVRPAEKVGILLGRVLHYIPFLKRFAAMKVDHLAAIMVDEALKEHNQAITVFENLAILQAKPTQL